MYLLPNKKQEPKYEQDTLMGNGQSVVGGTDDEFRNKRLDEFKEDELPFY